MQRLSAAIQERGLAWRAAAAEIGVTLNTLERHLRGEHVRSDSRRKYEDWLEGRAARRRFRQADEVEHSPTSAIETEPEPPLPAPPERPHLVVDIFSGCGGLSLGFDLLGGGKYFRTVLAMDLYPAAVGVLNRNHARMHENCKKDVGRIADLTEFLNETEVVAFYMDHVTRLHGDKATTQRLHAIADGLFVRFLSSLRTLDERFINELTVARASRAYRSSYEALDKGVLGQTSVIGFQEALKLPKAGRGQPTLPQVIWSEIAAASPAPKKAGGSAPAAVPVDFLREAQELWEHQLSALEAKKGAKGKGQLTSSARRIMAFATFARSSAFTPVREAWCRWQAARLALRASTFSNDVFARDLRALYEESYPVSVLLGGPPCQGFSRIGRGKIRSLREAHVQVHVDDEAGDARNLLYQRYLLVVSALRPRVFKFENVQHFQSTVKTGAGEFLASEILAEAIAEMSEGEVSYAVASRTVDASRHGVPQTRQRFFMSGLRRDAFGELSAEALALRCLSLPGDADVPLSTALDGLPNPSIVGGDLPSSAAMSKAVQLDDHPDPAPANASARYRAWVRQPGPHEEHASVTTDAHAARAAREDDAALFSLLGPGKRWMDYRVEESPTLNELRKLLESIASLNAKELGRSAAATAQKANDLLAVVNGSLALRLLMEQIGAKLEAPHHLVTPTYLSKRDGNHGDWLARLDSTRPCKTVVAHMGKDTYGYVHPYSPRTLSVREAARVQTFPDWFSFGDVALTDALKMIGNAVPPLLSYRIARRVAEALAHIGAGEMTDAA